MNRITTRSIATLALVAAMGVSIPAVAGADSTTTTTTAPTTTVTVTTTTAAHAAWKAFHASWKAYVDGLRSINLTYRSSVQSARAAYFAAIAAATTPAERQAARVTLDAAIAADINVRVAAITAAGDPPAPPAGYNGTAYVEGIQAANVAFRATATAARAAFATSLASATTPWERKSARLTLELALGNALVVRSSALTALGPPPTNPGQPS
jgi:hypothetical protein